jgi:hypothetical protein
MRRALILVLALAATLAAAPTAFGATLATDTRCYPQTNDVVVSGTGFTPSAGVSVTLDGAPFKSAVADASGAVVGKFQAQELPADQLEAVHVLTATDAAGNTAATRFRVTKVYADFMPDTGDPQTLQVRFEVHGFGLLRRGASVYLHYVNPHGKSVRDVRLGTAHGTCGKITATRLRHLFPFPEPERGKWILQFDTNSKYTRATSKSPYIWVRKPVEIFRK